MKDDLPIRKHPRLKKYDYSQNGCYFVTICVKNREPILSTIHINNGHNVVGRDDHIPPLKDDHIPPLRDDHIPPLRDDHIPPLRDDHIPPLRDDHIPPLRDDHIPPQNEVNYPNAVVHLTELGEKVNRYIMGIAEAYSDITIPKYIIMPDHIHLIVAINHSGGMKSSRPTLNSVIRSFKTLITKDIGYSIWQASFYEHIIRNEQEYCNVWNYIDNNPQNWHA